MDRAKLDLDDVFCAALELASPTERDAYLDQACGGDLDARKRVERLLAAHSQAGSFLGTGPSIVAATTELPTQAIGKVIGPYKLLQQIGEGGMGTVFMAEQTRPVQRKVALKLIKPGMDSRQVIARFEAERQALALMDHVNIARVFDGGATETGRPYFVMELVHGVPITEYCDANHLTPRERLELFVPVCQAIQHAHQKGIVHRDVKPSNVMVTLYDGKPVPKVIDFGVAKATEQKLTERTLFTQYGAMVGTLEYMSPEQAEMSALGVDTRSDIYSLGVLLYELLTGTTPLTHKRIKEAAYGEILRLIKEEEPPRPSTRLSDSGQALASISAQRQTEPAKLSRLMRGELDWIVMKTLEKDRTRRYDSASAFASDVQRYLNDETVQACPPSATYRLRKFARHNKRALATAALLLAVVLGGAGVAAWQAVRATRAEHRALEQAVAVGRERDNKEEALRSAKEELATREAVLAFVENKIFAAARPKDQAGGLGRDVQLRQAVEAALPFVEKSFTDQPLTEARLRQTLGVSFMLLGNVKVAAEQLQAAHRLYVQHRGPYHPDTLPSMLLLGASYGNLGRHLEALQLEQETLALMKSKFGPNHPDTLTAMNNLANTYAALSRDAEALKLREETLALQKARLGPDHLDTVSSMHNLASSYEDVGRNAEALKLREETLRLRKAKLGPGHPLTLAAMNNLANSYIAFGRYVEALRLNEETLALRKARLGYNHPHTLTSMHSLANSYEDVGRNAEALKLREATLALQKAKLGPDHPDTLMAMLNLANSYATAGRHADALKLREETLAMQKAKLGPDHRSTLRSMTNLATSYAALGRQADALQLREETLPLQKAALGPDDADTLTTMYNLANSYHVLGRDADALRLREETLAIQKTKFGPDHPDTLLSMKGIAESLVGLGRGAEAVLIIDECMRRSAGKVVPDPGFIPGLLDLRLRHFAKAKDPAGCQATAQMWEKLKLTEADSLYNAACFRAVSAAVIKQAPKTPGADAARLAKKEADEAMVWLNQAVAAGFKDTGHMKTDTDLDALRGRPDFQELVAQLAAGKEKHKK